MDIIEKKPNLVVLQGKLSKISKMYLGFYLPKKLEAEYGKNADVTVIIEKKTKKIRR